jgi:hypothetical protein
MWYMVFGLEVSKCEMCKDTVTPNKNQTIGMFACCLIVGLDPMSSDFHVSIHIDTSLISCELVLVAALGVEGIPLI